NDGKYYKATDVDDKGNVKSAANGQVAPKVVDNPQLSLVNHQGETKAPVVLGNVASGLGLPASETDPQKAAELAKAVEDKVKAVGEKAQALSTKAQTVTDLTLAVSGLEMAMNAMPEGEGKTKLQAQLESNKTQLEKAKQALIEAKTALTEAQKGLTAANKAYEQNDVGYAKVADLVKPDSKADLTHVATIGDLQAVARAGLNFEGNDGIAVHQNVGETLTLKGEGEFNSDNSAAGNIKVEMAKDGRGLEVKLSDTLKNMTSFETREIDGKTSRLDSNGLKVVDKDSESVVTAQGTRIAGKGNHAGKSASYTLDGVAIAGNNGSVQLNTTALSFAVTQDQAGKPVGTGVIRGLKDLDAHATGDMAANKNYVDAKHHELRTQLSHTNREMRAGIAGALAAATLPNSVIPGKSMFAASAGSFKGHSAIALGYSKMSDNGKISIRLQGTSNSAGDLGGAVGVGYLW
ncbi:YadA-like family protein, partial [Actinobacillus seminis]|uniref:YadA C-terminal domain-containing protein n=1 Tax=Actinobacillus seminis TaxID=722 RepID=UPI003B96024D